MALLCLTANMPDKLAHSKQRLVQTWYWVILTSAAQFALGSGKAGCRESMPEGGSPTKVLRKDTGLEPVSLSRDATDLDTFRRVPQPLAQVGEHTGPAYGHEEGFREEKNTL